MIILMISAIIMLRIITLILGCRLILYILGFFNFFIVVIIIIPILISLMISVAIVILLLLITNRLSSSFRILMILYILLDHSFKNETIPIVDGTLSINISFNNFTSGFIYQFNTIFINEARKLISLFHFFLEIKNQFTVTSARTSIFIRLYHIYFHILSFFNS